MLKNRKHLFFPRPFRPYYQKKKGIMSYIWRTFYFIFKSLAFVVEILIYLLSQLKDGLCFIKDWFSERELLSKW